MATAIDTEVDEQPAFSFPQTSSSGVLRGVLAVLKVLASLKITVVLFAMAIFIVFVGTLAQTENDIWKVVHTYFRSAFVWIPFQIFPGHLIFMFFPGMKTAIPGSFPFFGGWAAIFGKNDGGSIWLAAHPMCFKISGERGRGVLLSLTGNHRPGEAIW